ncbi:diacylglycerol/lipid kinase family protein [Actinomadura scrupuli]|uniref:diacylglycerol/lipid kinase family protein n=1 Tax=Actinomadura scrupuli TaxID=559629 RepID=UPI003D99CA6A
MRAMLIANPKATSTTRRVRDLLVRTFSGDLDLELAETAHRDHATQLARRAADDYYDVVVALGGDGTVNEVVNGLLTQGPSDGLPALAVLPCGSANVFARALGLTNDPVQATRMILDALRAGRYRTVGLGQADERYFTFCSGLGLDAEVVRVVEELRHSGSRANPALYVRAALRQFFSISDRRRPALMLERPGLAPVRDMFLAIVSNTSPWTYLGSRPVFPSPRADFNSGLDVFGTHRLDTVNTVLMLTQMLFPLTDRLRGGHVVNVHDATEITLSSSRPIAFQLDGDYLGEREGVTFRSVPKAIRIVI